MKLVWTLFGACVLPGGCRACRVSSAQSRSHRVGLSCGSHHVSPDMVRWEIPASVPWLDAEQSRAGINDTSTPSTRAPQDSA